MNMIKQCPSCDNKQECDCGECHNCGASIADVEPTLAGEEAVTSAVKEARTQKHKGIRALQNAGFNTPAIWYVQQQAEDPLATGQASMWYPLFARPCPVRPRHGFVESRVIKSEEERLTLVKETFAADPTAEIIYMQLVRAKLSAIWTPHLLTVGSGHDGATSGRDAVMVPLTGMVQDMLRSKAILGAAGFGPDDYPYVEAVRGSEGEGWLLTQLRAGPKIESTRPDYVTKSVTVKRIIPASCEIPLLEWEKTILAAEDGDVVYHPTGSLSDHISVHAIAKGIPIFKTREPAIGETIEPPEGALPLDPAMILKGAVIADEISLLDDTIKKSSTNLLLVALHNAAAMTGDNSKWLGVATTMMLRLGAIACRGELRHAEGSKNSRSHRDQVYNRLANRSIRFHRASLRRMANVFRYGAWPRSGYGGSKWAACALSLAPLFNALGRLAKDPSEENAGGLLRALNVAVNQAHNGGWWLNKFTDEDAPDVVQRGNIQAILIAGQAIRAFEEQAQKIAPNEVERKIGKWALWRDLSTAPPPIDKIEATIVPYSGGLHLTVKTRLTRAGKKIEIPYSKLTNILMERLGDIILTTEQTGLKITAQREGQSTTLWEEPPIDFGKGS